MTAPGLPNEIDRNALSTLFDRYETLCDYCDNFFTRFARDHSSQMRCAKGCASCCLLETVAPLEAWLISDYLHRESEGAPPEDAVRSKLLEGGEEQCVFLERDACRIYPVRPIICRTHGLPIRYPDRQEYDVCPLNFSEFDLESLDPQSVLDAEMITTNFMRLNLAFCLLTDSAETADERISLADILRAK